MKVRLVCIEPEDALELGELLGFLDHWFASDNSLAPALDRFVGGGYDAEELRADLLRFASLLGCRDEHATGGRR
ncbi:MAG: hypothetical protein M3066_00780 [Actinomycetota bacterium]|nr:hypothetical protein [Actinomycetota bacterium]